MARAAGPWLLTLALATAACGSDEPSAGTNGAAGTSSDKCPGADQYRVGIEKSGSAGLVTVTILDATPAPPHVGDNSWMVRITDPAGAPIDSATLVVSTFMPRHGHSGVGTVGVTAMGDGKYELEPVNFNMDELWEVTIRVESASATESVVFKFCVTG